MKKVLILIVMLVWAGDVHAVKLCGKLSAHPWKSDTSFSSASSYTCNPTCQTASSSADATWTTTITNGLGRSGSISGQSRCAANGNTNPPVANTTASGTYCWCRVTSITDSTNNITCNANANGAPWVFYSDLNDSGAASCRQYCAISCAGSCVRYGTSGSCSRTKLLTIPSCTWLDSSFTPVSAVTCLIEGTCSSNADYKTVADNASCGDGYVETTSPALTISGTYSDGKGSFTYGNCTAN
jgi:hypothetical protein